MVTNIPFCSCATPIRQVKETGGLKQLDNMEEVDAILLSQLREVGW